MAINRQTNNMMSLQTLQNVLYLFGMGGGASVYKLNLSCGFREDGCGHVLVFAA